MTVLLLFLMETFSGTGGPKGGIRGKPPATGAWHHLAWTYGGGKLRLSIDGVVGASTADGRERSGRL